MKIHTIVTHHRPHFDEIVAIWLLRKFGSKIFQEVADARIVFWNSGESPEKKTAEEYERSGVLLLGVGGGRFDEHPAVGKVRKQGECTATLVAKAIGVADSPELEKILDYTLKEDTEGSSGLFDLARITSSIHATADNPQWALIWVWTALDVVLDEQHAFWTDAKAEYEKCAHIQEILVGHSSKPLKMVTLVSDNELVSKYARYVGGRDLAIVIQKRRSTGNVQIHTNKQSGVTLFNPVRLIRAEERKRKNLPPLRDWDAIGVEGKVEGAEEWYYQLEAQRLLNGSLTAPNVPPTKIPLVRIEELVRMGLDPRQKERSFAVIGAKPPKRDFQQ